MPHKIVDDANLLLEGFYSPKGKYGLCNKCKFLKFKQTQYGKESVWCTEDYDIVSLKPSPVDPIQDCSTFYPKGQPSIYEMTGMAWIINRSTKIKPGFGSTINITIEKPKKSNNEIY